MKQKKYTLFLMLAAAVSCTSFDDIVPQGGTMLDAQLHDVIGTLPERAESIFTGMYSDLGRPVPARAPLDFGFTYVQLSNDFEGADIVMSDNGYNWFSPCFILNSRNGDYTVPYNRYKITYNIIADANKVLLTYGDGNGDKEILRKMAQARAVRAFAYLHLAPYYQFAYATSADKPCVPIVTEKTVDHSNNPRATVKKVYELILEDLTFAITTLDGYQRPDKSRIDQNVAYALRARTYLYMGMGAEAAADAGKAMEGYAPAGIGDISRPAFFSLEEKNWIWGYRMDEELSKNAPMATSTSWIRSFSSISYAGIGQLYARINTLLYDKIPSTDVRKGWWVDDKLQSPNMESLTWTLSDGKTVKGSGIAALEIPDTKTAFLPYTNVKFGVKAVGTTVNGEDWPWIRVEEMILTQAEGYLLDGKDGQARQVLEEFVRTYRDPGYDSNASGRSLRDEIWFQRRVELWGEGFYNADARRMEKPTVRFHDDDKGNFPEKFRFNVKADDDWLLHRFPKRELNNNPIPDNTGGSLPVQDQHPELRDGVTD